MATDVNPLLARAAPGGDVGDIASRTVQRGPDTAAVESNPRGSVTDLEGPEDGAITRPQGGEAIIEVVGGPDFGPVENNSDGVSADTRLEKKPAVARAQLGHAFAHIISDPDVGSV